MDCPLGQGFLWSEAVPAEEALALVGKGAMPCNGIRRRL
jgi:EAL domain-containing protein (putative c-di-GMP-specific phosphodiesterase class I)